MKRQKWLINLLSLPLATCLLAGCVPSVSPYTRPVAPVPGAWPSAGNGNILASEKAAAQLGWREFFGEGRLQKLIELTVNNNRDLRIAALNIERVRALYQIRGADLWPRVEGSGGASFQRLPEDFSGSGSARKVEQYTVGLGVTSYELDLFGRVRSLKEQALDQFLASEQARRALQISLVAQVANGYLNLAGDRERLKIAEETLANQQASLQLIDKRFRGGIATALAVSQAQSAVESARLEIARLKSLVAQDENALALVVGAPLPAELLPVLLTENSTLVKELRLGLSSEVLLERPDIRQAEILLQGYQANINAARAAFFPRITLVSSVGFGSDALSDLFSHGSLAWSFIPRVTLPIFDSGVNQANLKVAEADRDIAVALYEKAIQVAFREVSDGLALRATIGDQLTAQQALVEANTESLRLSQARFDQGVDSYLPVLDAQRSLYGAQQNLIALHLARLANLVTLYKVLGGGSV